MKKMKKIVGIVVLFAAVVLVSSCNQHVCPAYADTAENVEQAQEV